MRERCRFQLLEAEDAQGVVDVLGRPGPESRDPGQLEQRRRNLGLEAGQEFELPGGHVLVDLLLDCRTNPGNVLQLSLVDQLLDLGRQVVELAHCFAIGADLEEVLAFDLEQVGHPVQHGRHLGIPHVATLAGA